MGTILCLGCLLLIQLLANAPRRAAEDSSSAWATTTHLGDPDEVPGACLQLGLALGFMAICTANQKVEDISMSFSITLPFR